MSREKKIEIETSVMKLGCIVLVGGRVHKTPARDLPDVKENSSLFLPGTSRCKVVFSGLRINSVFYHDISCTIEYILIPK